MRFNLTAMLLLGALATFSQSAQAGMGAMAMHDHDHASPEPNKSGPQQTAEQQAMAREYSRAMAKMHEGMMAGMQTSDPDKSFVLGMIPHHQGAIDMAQIMLKYGKDQQMRRLAQQIITDQKREVAQMQKWLADHQ